MSYNLHSGRELAEDDHSLDGSGEVETSIFEVSEVELDLGNCESGMLASQDVGAKELRELSIGVADGRRSEVLLEVVPHLFGSPKMGDGRSDQRVR